jgi:GTP pyrophosphokinase
MDIVRPETPVSRALETLAPTHSETGMELEGASVAAPPHFPAPSELAEPEGQLAPLMEIAEEPVGDEPPSGDAELDAQFRRLLATVRKNRPGDDLDLIRSCWRFCIQHHAGQLRASGELYIGHPLAVAQILADLKMDATAIGAGLLHDAVEDTSVTTAEIAKLFGEQVAHIVEGVTKLDKIKFANREDHQAENIRKMLLAMVTDLRVVIIKLADRLHNMRTLEHLKPEKQQRIARETLEVYAPLAHRLGMGKLRGELEDLAFRFIDTFAYEQLSVEVDALRGEGEAFLERIVGALEEKLREASIQARVEARIKRLYSIQQKLVKHNVAIDQVFDLFAVRVITHTEQDCYAVFGLLQNQKEWRPVPSRYKDFIAIARPNGYQSLHNSYIAADGRHFEVQIRTEDMHRVAEEGIAAHWKYKSTEAVSAKDEQALQWVRQMMEWQLETTDPNEFMSTLRIDLYPEEVYAFTPKGKVIVLPKDASPIDFAYAIHTDVGHATVGAKVNGRIVPLRSRLRNGDIVEITTQAGHAPSRDWLSYTKSSRAKNKIKHWLTENERVRAIEIGEKLLAREAKKYKISLERFKTADYDKVANEYGLGGEQDLLSGIGMGKLSTRAVLNKLEPGSTMPAEAEKPVGAVGDALSHMSQAVKRVFFGKGADSLQVEGQDDLLVYRARCCNPIRGEEIIGYVTRGKGVAVHARSCPNVQNLLYEADRRIEVEWAAIAPPQKAGAAANTPKPATYPVKLVVLVDDRAGLLKEFAAIISEDGTNIKSVETRDAEDNAVNVDFVIETLDLRHLTKLTQNLRKVPGVRTVHRVQKI